MKNFCVFLICLTACARPGSETTSSFGKYKKLSEEIEKNTSYNYSVTHSVVTIPEKHFEQTEQSSVAVASKKNLNIPESIVARHIPEKVITRFKSPRSFKEKSPIDWEKKRDNFMWKLGYGLMLVGILIFLIFGALALEMGWGLGFIIAAGAGLGFMVLSLPFLLIGWLIGNKSDPPPSGPADPVQ